MELEDVGGPLYNSSSALVSITYISANRGELGYLQFIVHLKLYTFILKCRAIWIYVSIVCSINPIWFYFEENCEKNFDKMLLYLFHCYFKQKFYELSFIYFEKSRILENINVVKLGIFKIIHFSAFNVFSQK